MPSSILPLLQLAQPVMSMSNNSSEAGMCFAYTKDIVELSVLRHFECICDWNKIRRSSSGYVRQESKGLGKSKMSRWALSEVVQKIEVFLLFVLWACQPNSKRRDEVESSLEVSMSSPATKARLEGSRDIASQKNLAGSKDGL